MSVLGENSRIRTHEIGSSPDAHTHSFSISRILGAGLAWVFVNSSLAIDHNDDGVSDGWARYYEAEDLVPEEDTDGDGFTNLQESIAWTDPRSARSRLQLEVDTDGGEIALVWPERSGVHYQIEASNDLAQWTGLRSFETNLPHPSPSSQPGDLTTWAPWLGGILEYDPLWGLAHGFYGPDSGNPEYGLWQDPDGDGLSNLLECYGDTDPFVGASKFQASFVGTGKHLQIRWSGADGLVHYQLEIPVEFTFLNEFEPAAENFLHFGSSLGDFFGAQPQHRSDPFRIQAFVAGEIRTHVSPDFVEEDASIPGVVMDQNSPVVFEEDHDGSAYVKWTGADGYPYVVRMRIRLGDWYWGRAGSLASF